MGAGSNSRGESSVEFEFSGGTVDRWTGGSGTDDRGCVRQRKFGDRGGQALKGTDVAAVVDQIHFERGAPKMLFCDNGTKFTCQILESRAYQNGVKIDFSPPGNPTDSAFLETFNGRLRADPAVARPRRS
jgi:transposase InsO family protein